MRRHRLMSVLLVCLLSLALSAGVIAQEDVHLTVAGWASSPVEDQALQDALAAFEAANPGVTAEFVPSPDHPTTMQTAFASGDYADVFYVDSSKLPDWAAAGVIAPATGNVEAEEGIFPSLVEAFTTDGTFWCVPKDFSIMALQYNKDMFDAAGLEYPTADWTWDDLRAAAETLTTTNDEGEEVLGLMTPPNLERWLPFLYQAGGTLFDEEGSLTLDTPEAQEAIAFYVGMVNDGIAGPPSEVDAGWAGEAFGEGRAAMAMEGNWVIKFLNDNYPDLNWGVAALPAGPGGGEATMVFTVCYGVAANTEHPEEAWALVNFLTGVEGQQTMAEASFGPLPVREESVAPWLENFGEEMQPFVDQIDVAHRWQLPVGFQPFIDTFNENLQQAFAGQVFPEDILTAAQEVGDEIQAEQAG